MTLGIETNVELIEANIRDHGSCLMKEEELKILFPHADSNSKLFLLLASLAHERRWSFGFQPHNGDVRIASLFAMQAELKPADAAVPES